ncbi:unnamed protein product [Bemisia tabaci]|uniref:Uncharacterized protein n=1 Tax=Bemisia tabaci TaxID=7038 RepID=A0A9P0G0T3_BEMTA|nr:unnamed protein product [Bemisia tabaci]
MRTARTVVLSVGLLVLISQLGTIFAWKYKYYKGILLLSKDLCANRCKLKHGFFKDGNGVYQPASVAKRYIIKCQCMVSRQLKTYIKKRWGRTASTWYSFYNFFGMKKRSRKYLEKQIVKEKKKKTTFVEEIEFITYEKLQGMMEKTEEIKRSWSSGSSSSSQTGSGARRLPSNEVIKNTKLEVEIQTFGEDGKPIPGKKRKVALNSGETKELQDLLEDVVGRVKREDGSEASMASVAMTRTTSSTITCGHH